MPVAESVPQTLYDKVLAAHVVDEKLDGTVLLYIGMLNINWGTWGIFTFYSANLLRTIDRHLVHEVTSPVRHTRNSGCAGTCMWRIKANNGYSKHLRA